MKGSYCDPLTGPLEFARRFKQMLFDYGSPPSHIFRMEQKSCKQGGKRLPSKNKTSENFRRLRITQHK